MPAASTRLAALCREHVLDEKILIAPSLAIGHQITDAIAHGGTSWVNLRVETVRTLSDAVAGFALAGEGVTVLSRAQALAIIERSCDRVLDGSSYFAKLAGRPGLHRAIQRSIDDLRHAGVDPARVPPSAFEDPRKGVDLIRIMDAYEEELKERRFVDRFGVLSRAMAMLQSGAPRPWAASARWLVIDGIELTGSEDRLLRLIAGRYETVSIITTAGELSIDFRKAMGEENEIRGAFRSILSSGRRFDETELVYTIAEHYLPLTYELAAEYEVPCTFAEGIPAYFTRPGQACMAFLSWLGGGWHAAELQHGATAGAIELEGLSGMAFNRVMRASAIGWGRERYLPRLDALLADRQTALKSEDDESRCTSIERRIGEIHATRKAIKTLLELTAGLATGQEIEAPAAARAAMGFVAVFAKVRNEMDVMAREALRRVLHELAVLPGTSIDRSEVAARLSEAVRRVHVSASNPRPGFLHVAPIRSGGWSGRPRLFVAGLDESRHPGAGLQDPIVLDAEREEINRTLDPHQLLLLGDAPKHSAMQFRQLLGRARAAQITLSYCALDLHARRERYPSRQLVEVFREVGSNEATYEEVARSVAREGFVDPAPLNASEWWLMRRFADHAPDFQEAVHRAYAGLDAGAIAEETRGSDVITPWDGLVIPDGTELDPRRNGRVYSASQLESMARCPFQYFLSRVLKLRPLEELEFEPDRWLEPREFGSMVHELLQEAMERLKAGVRKPSLHFLPEMETMARAALDRWRATVPPPSEAAFARREQELLQSCEIFLRSEEQLPPSVTPKYFEVSFGFDESGADTIAMPEPLRIPLKGGHSIALRGRIDRIDHDEAADEWHIWDYKSGSTYGYDRGGQLQRGTKVQHAIYARALEAMLARKNQRGRVVSTGYFFPTPRGRGARIVPGVPDHGLEEALDALCDVISSGFFPHAAPKLCSWCEFESVCGGTDLAGQRMQTKLFASPGDERVAAWLRLQELK